MENAFRAMRDLFLFHLLCLAFALVVWTSHNKSAVYLVLLEAGLSVVAKECEKGKEFHLLLWRKKTHNEPATKKIVECHSKKRIKI
jgi:hypothetical protein